MQYEKKYKILIIGYGSIGKRHIRILREMANTEVLRIHGNGTGREIAGDARNVSSIQEAILDGIDFAIISNPTSHHVLPAFELAMAGVPFIIEKPVSSSLDGLDELIKAIERKSLPVMVAFQMREDPGYNKLKDMIDAGRIGRPLCFQGRVGQYLPDWRPNSDYRQCYSAKTDLGGGAILDLCHEIDIALSIMGSVERLSCFCGHYSELEIDSEDLADIIMIHKNGSQSHINLNYLERGYEWNTKVIGTEGSILWDYAAGCLELTTNGADKEIWKKPKDFERDDLYRRQMRSWLEVMDGRKQPAVDIRAGIEVTRIALAAKMSADERRHVTL